MRQRLSKTKTWIAITLVLLGAVLVFAVRKERASAGEFFTAPVDMGSLRTSVNATGAVQTVVTVQVGSQISGQILELYADYNSMVKRGQLLAKIDPRNFQAQVENAQASVAAAQARMIMPGNIFFGGASLGAGAASTLTEEDVQAMVREIPTIAAASPVVRASGQMVFGNQNWFSQIQGANEKFPLIRNWKVERGDFFTDLDVRSADRVIVLGKTVADKLFSGVDPVGQMIRVRNLPFRVVGVLAAKGQSMVGQDQDDTAVVPYTTAQRKLLGQQIPSINQAMISSISPEASAVTEKQVSGLLRQRHKIQPGQTDDFMVRNMTDIAQASAQITTLMTILLGSIAAISLIVGGIGIMNIMPVSVTERTRDLVRDF